MHELAVTEGIISTAVDAAKRNGGRRITAINLVIGELSSIIDDSVQFYFDLVSEGTLAAGAALHFRRVPATVTCLGCRREFIAVAPFAPLCPHCGGVRLQVSGGQDFYIDSIEVADEDPGRTGYSERE